MGWLNKLGSVFGAGKAPIQRYDESENPFLNDYSKAAQDKFQDIYGQANKRANTSYRQQQGQRVKLNRQGNLVSGQARAYNPFIDQLSAMSRGEGPSLAGLQLQQGLDRNIASQYGMMAGNRSNPALASRLAAQNIAGLGQQTAMDAAQARMQEQQAAIAQQLAARQAQSATQGQAANIFSNIRQGDMGMMATQQELAQNAFLNQLADQFRREQLGLANVQGYNSMNVPAYSSQQSRLGEMWSKFASAAGGMAGGAPTGGTSMAGNPMATGMMG